MPIFDDPQKELRRLHEQLLREDEEEYIQEDEDLDALIDEYAEEDYEEFFQEDYSEEYKQEPFYRNFSNGYGADVRNFANGYRGQALMEEENDADGYADWDEDPQEEPFALFREEKRGLFRPRTKEPKDTREEGIGKLKIILMLELIGILSILIWWVVMLL